jgi:hypothetical protein
MQIVVIYIRNHFAPHFTVALNHGNHGNFFAAAPGLVFACAMAGLAAAKRLINFNFAVQLFGFVGVWRHGKSNAMQ